MPCQTSPLVIPRLRKADGSCWWGHKSCRTPWLRSGPGGILGNSLPGVPADLGWGRCFHAWVRTLSLCAPGCPGRGAAGWPGLALAAAPVPPVQHPHRVPRLSLHLPHSRLESISLFSVITSVGFKAADIRMSSQHFGSVSWLCLWQRLTPSAVRDSWS